MSNLAPLAIEFEPADFPPDQGEEINIPVYFHVLYWGDSVAEGNIPEEAVVNQIAILNKSFRGSTNGNNLDSRIRFQLKGITRTKVDTPKLRVTPSICGPTFYQEIARPLMRGGRETLNVYSYDTQCTIGQLLGISSFPTLAAEELSVYGPGFDGLVISHRTVPAPGFNPIPNYDLGLTLPHEVGHWLGLYHTFQQWGTSAGCVDAGDFVDDTPAQKVPELRTDRLCEGKTALACRSSEREPEHNYMNYKYDSCYSEFSADQIARMRATWHGFRAPGAFIHAIANSISYLSDQIAPGSLATIFGTGLSATTLSNHQLPIPAVLGDTSVTVDGIPAPLLYVSPGQVNLLVPGGVRVGRRRVILSRAGHPIATLYADVNTYSPGISTSLVNNVRFPVGLYWRDGKFSPLFDDKGAPRKLPKSTEKNPGYLVLYGTGFKGTPEGIPMEAAAFFYQAAATSLPDEPLLTGVGVSTGDHFTVTSLPQFPEIEQLNILIPWGLDYVDELWVKINSGYRELTPFLLRFENSSTPVRELRAKIAKSTATKKAVKRKRAKKKRSRR